MFKINKIKIQRENKIKNNNFNLNIFNKFLFLLIMAGGVYYVTIINDLSAKSFKIQELKEEISCLENENSNFESKVMSLNSFSNLKQKVEKLDMVAVNEINYIHSSGAVVVKK